MSGFFYWLTFLLEFDRQQVCPVTFNVFWDQAWPLQTQRSEIYGVFTRWIREMNPKDSGNVPSQVSLSHKWTMSRVMESQKGTFWQIICPMSKADDMMLLDGFDLTRHLIYLECCIQTSSPSSTKTKRLGALGIDMWSQGCDPTTLHFLHQYVTWLPDPAI